MGSDLTLPPLTGAALRSLYETGTAADYRAALLRHGPEAFNALQPFDPAAEDCCVRPDAAVAALDLTRLRVLLEGGVSLSPCEPDLLAGAVIKDDPAVYHFLRSEMGCTDPLDTYESWRWLVLTCGPKMAPFLAAEMDGVIEAAIASGKGDMLPDYCQGTMHFKEFALLLTAQCDIRPAFHGYGMDGIYDRIGPRARDLIEMTGSAHGRLALHRLEPSRAAILARPATGPFFGMQEDTFHSEVRVAAPADPGIWPIPS